MSSHDRCSVRPDRHNALVAVEAQIGEGGRAAIEASEPALSYGTNKDVLATFTLDADGRIISWSDGAVTCHGHHSPEIVGLHLASTYAAADQASGKHESALEVARKTGSFKDAGWRVRKDGSRFWAHVTIDALRDRRGHIVGFANVTRDLTVMQRNAEIIRKANLLQLALNNMSTGLAMFDSNERLCLWNANWKLLTPSTRSLLHGARFEDVIRGSLEDQGLNPKSEVFEALVNEKHEQHLQRLSRAGDAACCEEIMVGGRTQIHSHRAMQEGGWITTIYDATNFLDQSESPIHRSKGESR